MGPKSKWTAVAGVLALAGLLAAQDEPRQKTQKAREADHQHAAQSSRVERAVAVLQATGESGVKGTIYFTQRGKVVEITGRVMGLEPGKHGFHVHEYGDLTDLRAGKSAGDHFNPTDAPHGRPDSRQRHVGDLGNIEADDNGVAKIQMRDELIQLNGPHSILGRAVVVHAKEDQFTQPSGDAGDRVALGVIGVAQPERVRQAREQK